MEALRSSETAVSSYRIIPDMSTLHTYRCENLKSSTLLLRYKVQPVNILQGNNHCIECES
jgi:hypothetical protein